MNDHASRIHAQQQQAEENAAMESLKNLAAPLFGAVAVAVLLLAASGVRYGWAQWQDMQRQNDAMMQCLNGRPLALGKAVLRCQISSYELVDMGGKGDQP
jgi:uncharacterized protein HemX